ncbi:ATP-binding cassette domain-containing protein [Mycolicibacterium sp. P9-64]|uniref:ABC transporter ATP-binding protein n=1 Tax=Mycolicibacterium sp. P9-64 TaxID=2024612 RepID=UPI0011F06C41|nr:oligopeptide/dipeptide ABC transporter ATP-binding protein [Mycolicibacterium sp. P9-64]KAA0085283.1 ATP-binding cassette domain-containing protein [Mycolicibacterium sp. P9-64]
MLELDNVVKSFPVQSGSLFSRRRDQLHAVNEVSLQLHRGETLGLVGETGCGKSTLARCAMRSYDIDSGTIVLQGRDISTLSKREMRPLRRRIQMIFQDPYGSLNPRRRVGSIIGDPLRIHSVGDRTTQKRTVQETMELVGLNPEHYNRFPAEFSGGQRQRIGIARALIVRPDVIICDEPVSALDVSIQAQILNLLTDLQRELDLTYLFIGHDLSVVRHISDRVAVMYLGKIVEIGETQDLFEAPRHPYTAALLSAVREPDPDTVHNRPRVILQGDPPSPIALPSGCSFHPRCPKVRGTCSEITPTLEPRLDDSSSHLAACHFPVERGEQLQSVDLVQPAFGQSPAASATSESGTS